MMVSTVRSVSCLLFFYSRCLLCPAICKSGGHDVTRAPCAPWSRRHWTLAHNRQVGYLRLKQVYTVSCAFIGTGTHLQMLFLRVSVIFGDRFSRSFRFRVKRLLWRRKQQKHTHRQRERERERESTAQGGAYHHFVGGDHLPDTTHPKLQDCIH